MHHLQQVQDDEYAFPYHYVSQFRNGFTQTFYDGWGINYVSTIEFILGRLSEENFSSCVDIGCGDGRLAKEIKSSFPDKRVLGIDYSARAIALAKSMNSSGDYAQIDIINSEVPEQFDLGILMEVFEHINPDDSDKFVAGIAKLLKPRGILYVTVPHINKPVEYKHFRHFTSELLVSCFEKHFKAETVICIEKGRLRKNLIDMILGNRLFILNVGRIRRMLYNYYKTHLFLSAEKDCNRIIVKFIKK